MAVFGKNGLYAAGLYFAALFAVYGQKKTGFKDDKEIDAIAILVARKAKPDKAAIAGYRTRILQSRASDKRYGDLLKADKTGKASEYSEAYLKKEWLR